MGWALAMDASHGHFGGCASLANLPAHRLLGLDGGILILIPMVNLVFLYFIAFTKWPADKAGTRSE